MKNTVLFFLTAAILFVTNTQAQDPYHQSLIDQLADSNLIVNTFYIADNEASKMACPPCSFNPFNKLLIQEENVSARGFSMGVKVAAYPNIDEKPWDYNLRFTSQVIPAGESVLLTFWTHGIPNQEGNFGQLEAYVRELGGNEVGLLRKFLVLEQEWQQWFLPIQGTGEALRIDLRMGGLSQSLYFGGIALMGGNNFSSSNLPLVDRHDRYEGSEPGATWRADAAARIETYRKANFNCQVLDLNGTPIEQAEIVLNMQEHAFAFGVANPGYLQSNNPEYKNRLLDLDGNGRRLNTFVFEADMQWPYWVNPVVCPNTCWGIDRNTLLNEINWLVNNNLRLHGHTILWPNDRYLEVDTTQSEAFIENAISEHITDILTHPDINGKFASWDVLNEPTFNVLLEGKFGFNNVLNLYRDVFDQVANLDPSAKRMLNDYVPIGNGAYSRTGIERHKMIVDGIQSNSNNAIQALGFQCHMRYPVPPAEVWELLNEYNEKTNEFIITEFDLKGVDESIQAAYTRDFLTAIFSHEQVNGFTMWNFRDSQGWNHSDTPIFDDNWNIKPSGQAFIDRVFVDWWSNEQEITDSNGQATIRAFKGKHTIQVSYDGITSTPYEVTLNEDNTLTIVLPIQIPNPLCNIVENENFDDNTNNWSLPMVNYSSASMAVNNGILDIDISDAGTSGWHCQLRQNGIQLEAGATYHISFNAYADAPRQIKCEIAESVSPYSAYYDEYFTVSASMQTYQLTDFTMPVSDTNARLNFYLGNDNTNIHFDNIQVIKLNCTTGCVQEMSLNDADVLSGTYQVHNELYSNGTIPANGVVSFKATNLIILAPEFSVESEAQFEAIIEDCNN